MTRSQKSIIPSKWAEGMEDIFHVVLGLFLFGIALAALVFSVIRVFTTSPFFPVGMIQAINDILFIIIIGRSSEPSSPVIPTVSSSSRTSSSSASSPPFVTF